MRGYFLEHTNHVCFFYRHDVGCTLWSGRNCADLEQETLMKIEVRHIKTLIISLPFLCLMDSSNIDRYNSICCHGLNFMGS